MGVNDARRADLLDRIDGLIDKGMELAKTSNQLYLAVAMLYVGKAVLIGAETIGEAIREQKGVS